jgi:hypothetical protein
MRRCSLTQHLNPNSINFWINTGLTTAEGERLKLPVSRIGRCRYLRVSELVDYIRAVTGEAVAV